MTGLVAARRSMLTLVVPAVLLAACSSSGGGVMSVPNSSATASPSAPSAEPLACLDPSLAPKTPRGGWLPDRGGVIGYNPDSTNGSAAVPSTRANQTAARFASIIRHGFMVTRVGENSASRCTVARWALLHDRSLNSGYLALIQLRRSVDPGSFPLLGDSIVRQRLGNGTEILSSMTDDGGVVTVVAARSDGLVAFIQIRRVNDEEGSGYPTTVSFPGASTSPRFGPAPISIGQAITAARTILIDGVATNRHDRSP